jgi:hypothetical protein
MSPIQRLLRNETDWIGRGTDLVHEAEDEWFVWRVARQCCHSCSFMLRKFSMCNGQKKCIWGSLTHNYGSLFFSRCHMVSFKTTWASILTGPQRGLTGVYINPISHQPINHGLVQDLYVLLKQWNFGYASVEGAGACRPFWGLWRDLLWPGLACHFPTQHVNDFSPWWVLCTAIRAPQN